MNVEKSIISCPLCKAEGEVFREFKKKSYYTCPVCRGIYLETAAYLTAQEEQDRYDQHNNDVDDLRYQEFVWPLVEAVQNDYSPADIGLDYGCGPGPVITKLLTDQGYQLKLYDPFFADYPENLKQTYDYIVCCEVMEHFHYPDKEFVKLNSLLKPDGALFMKTYLYHDGIDFDHWFYKNDPTHVFFYRTETLEWIQKEFGFSGVDIEDEYLKFWV